MPIVFDALKPQSLRDVLDPLGLTLVIREDAPDEWNAYMTDSSGVEYDLFDEWGVEVEETPRASLEAVAFVLSNNESELGEVTINCADIRVVVGPEDIHPSRNAHAA